MDKGFPRDLGASKGVKVPDRIIPDLLFFKTLLNAKSSKAMKEPLSEVIYDRFNASENPYIYVLDLLYYSPELLKQIYVPFNKYILIFFQDFLNVKNPSAKRYLNLEIQKLAANMFLQMKNQPWLELACHIFELNQQREMFKDIILSHFANGRYKQAYELIIALQMQPFFSLEEIALPLIFFDQRILVEQYLKDYPETQLQLVRTLDSACSSGYRLSEFIMQLNLNIRNTRRFDVKFVQKVLAKLLKTFDIPIDECPNLVSSRSFGALNYLMRKRFQEHEMTNESWEEMVLDTVKNNKGLQKELVLRLTCINEMELALKMARTLNLEQSMWPNILHTYVQRKAMGLTQPTNPSNAADNGSSWEDELDNSSYSENFLTLRIDESSIYIIDTVEKFMDCIPAIESYNIVGFDGEWRPSFGCTNTSKMALLQLAVWDCVFLLDVMALTQKLETSHWTHLMDRIFCNPNILKIGFSISSDLSMIKESCSGNKRNVNFLKVLDFDEFSKKVLATYPQITSCLPTSNNEASPSASSDKGLSKLCRMVLGTPLRKTEQFSDWERRPLRKTQIDYAALDAYCLLQVYEELSKIMETLDLNMEVVIYNYMHSKLVPPTKTVAKEQKQTLLQKKAEDAEIQNQLRPSTPISEFRVIVDNMLTGFGKQLRICGADVVMLENDLHHSIAVKRALTEKRCFLTTGKIYAQLCDYLPDGMCYNVDVKQPISAQIASVCKHYNVGYSETDVFSRCTLCNCSNYLKIKSEDMELLWTMSKTAPQRQTQNQHPKPLFFCEGGFVTEEGIMNTGVKIKMEGMSDHILLAYSEFKVCCNCGKLYWEGSHHQHKKETVQSWMKSQDVRQEKNVAEIASSSKDSMQSHSREATHTSQHSQEHSRNVFSTRKTFHSEHLIAAEDYSSDDDCGIIFN